MSAYFLDTSAIVKRYCLERGQSWMRSLCNPLEDHDFFISQAALVEVVTAFCRKAYLREITITQRDEFIDTFRTDCNSSYTIKRVTDEIYIAAGNLCRVYNLRAYDAVQLSCAVNTRKKLLTDQMPPPIFVCADKRLVEFAYAEGLTVDNPQDHPSSSEVV